MISFNGSVSETVLVLRSVLISLRSLKRSKRGVKGCNVFFRVERLERAFLVIRRTRFDFFVKTFSIRLVSFYGRLCRINARC